MSDLTCPTCKGVGEILEPVLTPMMDRAAAEARMLKTLRTLEAKVDELRAKAAAYDALVEQDWCKTHDSKWATADPDWDGCWKACALIGVEFKCEQTTIWRERAGAHEVGKNVPKTTDIGPIG